MPFGETIGRIKTDRSNCEKGDETAHNNKHREAVEITVKAEADQFDHMGERVKFT